MDIAYTDRDLTAEELTLTRRWLRDRCNIAGLVLLSLRLTSPSITTQEAVELDAFDIHGMLYGLAQSVAPHYARQLGQDAFRDLNLTTETRH